MELQELNKEEIMAIYGGNELSQAVCYYAGKAARVVYDYIGSLEDGHYSYYGYAF